MNYVQRLIGRVAALNRFISRLGEHFRRELGYVGWELHLFLLLMCKAYMFPAILMSILVFVSPLSC
jgi:hypothetical protein